jgi:hypothetical protein
MFNTIWSLGELVNDNANDGTRLTAVPLTNTLYLIEFSMHTLEGTKSPTVI